MGSLAGKTPKQSFKSLLRVDDDTNGVDSTLEAVTDGEGTAAAIRLSTNKLAVKPSTDSTSLFNVQDKDANSLLTVDSTNDVVKLGVGQHYANTAIKDFYLNSGGAFPSAGNTWTAMGQGSGGRTMTSAELTMGTGTDPATTYTISTTADDMVNAFWYLPFPITIDSVRVWWGADAASGDAVQFKIMGYDVDTSNSTTGGDLTNGTLHCSSSAAIAGLGYEQAYTSTLTIDRGAVDSGQMLGAFFMQDGTNADLAAQLQIIYHLR